MPGVFALLFAATTFLGVTDALFDAIEGNRAFDISWGIVTGSLCLAVAAPMLWWLVCRRPVSYFGRDVDPSRGLQFAWGIFGMFMAFTNVGCRLIPHHHLDWVHPGFLIITVLYVGCFGPRVVLLARQRRTLLRTAAAAVSIALLLTAALQSPAHAAEPADAVTPVVAYLNASCRLPVEPVHGVVSAVRGTVVDARLDAVAQTRAAGPVTARLALPRGGAPVAGENFDAMLATCASGRLELVDLHAARAFVAGVPDEAPQMALAAGGAVPDTLLLDARGRALDLAATHGKILLLSFVFTRCPDRSICPAIAGKFAYMQQHLDPAKYHLALVTLDPPYDSPAVLAAYGRALGADPARWSLLTGEPSDAKHLVEHFGITSLADRPGRYVHDDKLVLARADGTIDRIVDTAGWSPDDVIAAAQTLGGEVTNPLRRIELASISGLAALCGGNQAVGVVVLDSIVFLLGVGILGSLLVWWGRQIFARGA